MAIHPTDWLVVERNETLYKAKVGDLPSSGEVFVESNPMFTYSQARLIRIDYASGNSKTFNYQGSQLAYIDYTKFGTVYRKTFVYEEDRLVSIEEAEI